MSLTAATMMPFLFAYGTLQDSRIQIGTFGRALRGTPDALVGFERAAVPIDDPAEQQASGLTHYANATPSGDAGARVTGTVFEVTDEELIAADAYEEPADYRRIEVALASGSRAWVYVRTPPPPASGS
jgi:gamma-glutamylcyclotransferase (GGCT)/AIG2-like uncharacterized protein YtfP